MMFSALSVPNPNSLLLEQAGFDQVMPDPRCFPKFLPRPFAKLSVHFGEPVDRIGSALDIVLNDLRVQPQLNPIYWEGESDHIRQLRNDDVANTEATPASAGVLAAPAIPVPNSSAFPKLSPISTPVQGWPSPPRGSRAALAQEATFNPLQSSPASRPVNESAGSPAFVAAAMDARSRLAELLRRELAFLGMRSQRAMGKPEGQLGRLVHTLMPESDGKVPGSDSGSGNDNGNCHH